MLYLGSEFCIDITSSEDENLCQHPRASPTAWSGGSLDLKHNGAIIKTIPKGFTHFEHCLPANEVDIKHDKFQLASTTNDGVCITSLTINNKIILGGLNNNQPNYWIDGDDIDCQENFMVSKEITILRDQIISPACYSGKESSKIFQITKKIALSGNRINHRINW